MLLKVITAINAMTPQTTALVLIVFGVLAFWSAKFFPMQDIREAILSAGTGLIAGGIMMANKAPHPKNSVDTPDKEQ